MAGDTGTIFDSPFFALERPAFKKLLGLSDMWLSGVLILIALVLLFVASLKGRPALKAVFVGWCLLP
jgi:hypothetical protein